MIKKIFLVGLLFAFTQPLVWAASKYPYQNAKLSVNERTLDLVSRMTLEEKVGQLLCPLGWEMYEKKGRKVTHSKKFEEEVQTKNIGMLWATLRADPWTQKTLETGLNPKMSAEATNALQKYVIENTRLGIPMFFAEEAPHGHMAIGATVFPTGIGQASTWSVSTITEMAAATAKEVRLQGGHISYGPVLDLSRDPRWSRVEESYGEDPYLMEQMGISIIKGLGSGEIENPYSTIATLKHFAAYGVPEGGHNGNASYLGERELRKNFLPPFKGAIDAGALSLMAAYNSIDGVPCSSNKFLLNDVLVGEWGFKGFTVSDLGSIEGIYSSHRAAKDKTDAAVKALKAGLDVDLGGNAFVTLIQAVKEGKVSEDYIDRAVYRVLYQKFRMGLFENPYVNAKVADKEVKSHQNRNLSRKVAQESIVLLENKAQLLPLKQGVKVAVVGPNADNGYNMLGDYTAPQDPQDIITVYKGIEEKVGKEAVSYVKGCAIRDTISVNIKEAVDAALKSDVVVAVVGGSSARDFKTKYIETGAAVVSESLSDMESGEGYDRSTLDLLGKQNELLEALKKTGKPLVVVYIQGRPLNMNWASENADALLCAWYPGQEGGRAIADVLFGAYNPAGRMPISVPKSVGQLPVYYNRMNPTPTDYLEVKKEPLYTFGEGKSFTTFAYSNLSLSKVKEYTYRVSFDVTNTGQYDGDEVVQLYLKNHFSSTAQPNKQLRAFDRINILKGETKSITFTLTADDFKVIDMDMKSVVEEGAKFSVLVGSSSKDIYMQEVIVL